ncbi:MAG TPA: MotA/TolQ/ExbB proton channel family protein [Gemmatales bacterium]|nr:MotA/TolQ/ExbB proton channel family protein [Gemmatales bacterium]HMP17592.1 MotA/TolQ/ExbB proton channel family protein [Gemmatales bacterium]
MWEVYWNTVKESGIDWFILLWGALLIAAHLVGLMARYRSSNINSLIRLERYRTVLLSMTELLPILGLLGTVLSLMNTFQNLQSSVDESPNLMETLRTFAPALSATCSGLLMIGPNLVLNALLWLAMPRSITHSEEVV